MRFLHLKYFGNLPMQKKIVVVAFVLCIYSWFLAPFSKYYISDIEIYFSIASLLLLTVCGQRMISRTNFNISFHYSLACFDIIFLPVLIYGEFPFVSVLAKLLFAAGFIALKNEYKLAIYDVFLSYFVILLFLGLIEFALLFVNVNFFWAIVNRGGAMDFYQGIFILVPSYFVNGSFRFMSLCEEPGTLGTICFFFLITLDYNNNKFKYLILLFAGLVTFSLGYYVLLILWSAFHIRKIDFSKLLIASIVIFAVYFSLGSIFQDRIIDRISGRSVKEIDNRTNEAVDRKLQEVVDNGTIIYGLGNRSFYEWETKVSGVSAGAKNFILQYGIISLIILVISFSYVVFRVRGLNRHTILVILFFWISFYKSNMWNNPAILLALLAISTNMFRDKLIFKKS